MAALIDPLASGLVGCAGGSVTIYQRGTTTPATVYTSFSETGATTGTAGVHTLDANGAIVLYTVEPLTILCKSNQQALVRTITFQGHAGNIEVKQAGYNAAASTNVREVLADLRDSLGASDGEVLLNGAPESLTDAINAVATVRLNVKTYGALGNGVGDDLVAIQNAINAGAATASPFEVYFPRGSYNVSGSIQPPDSSNCTFRGDGAASTFIIGTNLAASIVSPVGFVTVAIEKLTVTRPFNSGAATGHLVDGAASTVNLTLTSASLNTGGNSSALSTCHCINLPRSVTAVDSSMSVMGSGDVINAGAAVLTFRAANSTLSSLNQLSTGRLIYCTSTLASVSASGSTFESRGLTPADNLLDVAGEVKLSDCTVTTDQSAGTKYMIKANSSGQSIRLTKCKFTGSGGTTYLLRLNTAAGANRKLYEVNNDLSAVTWYESTSAPAVATIMSTPGIDASVRYYETSGTSETLLANFGCHVIRHTSGASLTIASDSNVRHTGRRISLTYTNNTGAGVTPTFSASFAVGTVPAVANGSSITMDFVWTYSGKWQQVGGNPIATA